VQAHDALRLVFAHSQTGWKQHFGGQLPTLQVVDLSGCPLAQLVGQIEATATHYQSSLDITKGRVVAAVLLKTPDSEQDHRLLLVMHHLVVDGVSWRILLEDLQSLLKGTPLGAKTASVREWYQALEHYGHQALGQLDYWQGVLREPLPLLVDFEGERTVAQPDMQQVVLRLDKGQTKALLQQTGQAYHTGVEDLLLAALAGSVSRWQKQDKLRIGLEGHGREALEGQREGQPDTSQTVGWLTSLYPLLLAVEPALVVSTGEQPLAAGAWSQEGLRALLVGVKEQRRALPGKGLGYGVLKYLKGCLPGPSAPWEVVFNYLGQLDQAVSGHDKLLAPAPEPAGKPSATTTGGAT
jgi:hypothetical protein